MLFGLQKCAILVMKRGKIEMGTDDMIMPGRGEIKAMGENSDYRYLGVLECNTVKNEKVKTLVQVEYKKRLKSMLKSKLNGGNLMKAINTYTASVVLHCRDCEMDKGRIRGSRQDDKEAVDPI